MKRHPLQITSVLVVLLSVGLALAQSGKTNSQPSGPRPAVFESCGRQPAVPFYQPNSLMNPLF